jgi:hypothetical protein
MTLANPPPAVTAARDMLLACASLTAAGVTTSSIHYPTAAIAPDAGTPDGLPCVLLAETSSTRNKYAEIGVAGLPGGTLTATIYASLTAGEIETLGRAVAAELLQQSTGLPLTDVSADLCSDPETGNDAEAVTLPAASHRAMTITINYGLRI